MPKSSKKRVSDQEAQEEDKRDDTAWVGKLSAQGLPALPFATIPPSVDMNLVMALAQVMTMNTLSALAQNQSIPQPIIHDQKAEKKQLMMTLQERLKNRKVRIEEPVIKKKKTKKLEKSSPQGSSMHSPSNISPLEILALATTAQYMNDNPNDASLNHRGSFSHLFESEKSPSIMTALQNGFPNIDWNKVDSLQSPSSEVLQSILGNVSETQKQT